MNHRSMACAALSALLLVGGCSSDDASAPGAGPARKFAPDALPTTGAAIYIRQKQLDSTQLVLELVGRDLADAYGVAWRLRFDPAVLKLASAKPTSAWSQSHVHVVREPRAGLLVGVVGAKGKQSGLDAADTALAEITFTRSAPGGSRLDFVLERSAVVHSDGRHAPAVAWIGGSLAQ
jgi:hypothetical protein